MGLGIAILLGKTVVNDIDLIAAPCQSHHEIVGLDVTVNEVLRMHELDP